MRVSLAWLTELLPALPEALGHLQGEALARAVAAKLTGVGLEVEAVTPFGVGLDGVLVAEVVAIRPHPTKSGLRLVTVERGGGSQEVVCGAPNVPDPGGLVVLAPLGVHLPAAAGGAGLTIALHGHQPQA
jgi:phenylalanyl-tRNA synthetase beta chain